MVGFCDSNFQNKSIIFTQIMDKNKTEDPSTKELNAFVQNMLKQMQ